MKSDHTLPVSSPQALPHIPQSIPLPASYLLWVGSAIGSTQSEVARTASTVVQVGTHMCISEMHYWD